MNNCINQVVPAADLNNQTNANGEHTFVVHTNTQPDQASDLYSGYGEDAPMPNAQIAVMPAVTTAVEKEPVYKPNADAISATVAPPAVLTSMGKQAKRQHVQSKFVLVRCAAEMLVSTPVNAVCGPNYNGVFEVFFDSPNEVTAKTLSTFTGKGEVYFTPNNIDEHPALKKIRKAEDGINLSALMTRAKRPANIDDATWQPLEAMWEHVSTVVITTGLTPVHALIARALTENGLGGPKISKKLSGGMNLNAGDKYEVMCHVLDHIYELLTANAVKG